MFKQVIAPVADSIGLSFLVAVLPVLAVLLLLGVLRRPAGQAALADLIVGLVIAIGVSIHVCNALSSGAKANLAGGPRRANGRRCTVDAPLTKTSSICLASKAAS